MTIQKKQLLESLKKCMPGIETGNAVLQGADSFVFHNGKIFTYNDVISVSVPIEQTGLVEETVEGAVKAKEFYSIIEKFPSDEIEFVVKEKGWLLKCGRAKAELNLQEFDFESRLNDITPTEEWVEVQDDFIQGIGVCQMTNNKTALSGIYINGKDIISTDGYQINNFTMKSELPMFYISDKSSNELLKVFGIKSMQVQGSWVHFKTEDGTVFSVKTLQGTSFPYDKVKSLIESNDFEKMDLHAKFPQEMFKAIERATSFGMEISERTAVKLELNKDGIMVSSERTSGRYAEKISWEEEMKDMEDLIIFVDTTMMSFISNRSTEFYVSKNPVGGRSVPRLFFVTDSSVHIMATLEGKN